MAKASEQMEKALKVSECVPEIGTELHRERLLSKLLDEAVVDGDPQTILSSDPLAHLHLQLQWTHLKHPHFRSHGKTLGRRGKGQITIFLRPPMKPGIRQLQL